MFPQRQDELPPGAVVPPEEVGQVPDRPLLLRRPEPERRCRRVGLLRRQEGPGAVLLPRQQAEVVPGQAARHLQQDARGDRAWRGREEQGVQGQIPR